MAENKAKAVILLAAALVWTGSLRTLAIIFFRCVDALVLLLTLPGFLWLRFFSPAQKVDFEYGLLSLGMSVALLPPLALLLHRFNALTPTGWEVALAVFCLAAWHYSGRGSMKAGLSRPAEARDAPPSREASRGSRRLLRLSGVALTIAMAVGIARYGALNHRQFAYTELWMLPSQRNDFQRVTIGIRNQEKKPSAYDLELTINGKLIERRSNLLVRNGDTWVEEAPTQFYATSAEQVVEAKLYRTDQPSMVYRHTLLKFVSTGGVSHGVNP